MLDPTLAMQLSKYSLVASLMLVVLALACYTSVLVLGRSVRPEPVSYTHLTLPTNREV